MFLDASNLIYRWMQKGMLPLPRMLTAVAAFPVNSLNLRKESIYTALSLKMWEQRSLLCRLYLDVQQFVLCSLEGDEQENIGII